MAAKTAIYSVAALYMCGNFVRHGLYMSALLLALPLDVPSTAEARGHAPVEQRFCARNPHTCMAMGEVFAELQLRSLALQDALGDLVKGAAVAAPAKSLAGSGGYLQPPAYPPLLEPVRPTTTSP